MCYQCKNGYYVSMEGTSCIKVEKQIEKCLSYSSNGGELFCSYCDKGYITSADQKTCKESKNCEYLTTNAKEKKFVENVILVTLLLMMKKVVNNSKIVKN